MGKRKRTERRGSSGMSEQELRNKLKFLKGRTDVCQRLYDVVRHVKSKSGHPKCEFLCRLPSRRSNPEYYKVISEPISFTDVEQKMKTSQYNDVITFVDDMERIFNNAQTFYEADSQEFVDVEALQMEFRAGLVCILREEGDTCRSPDSKRLKLKLSGGKVFSSRTDKECDDPSSSGEQQSPLPKHHVKEEKPAARGEGLIVQIKLHDMSTPSESWKPKREKQRRDYAELFGQRRKVSEEEREKMLVIYDLIVNEKDEDGLPMCEPFMAKPSMKKYPHYYVVIKRPIDLQEIKEKIDNDKYVSIDRFMADIYTLFRNAKFFNEESSTIYEYADILHKIAKAKYQQLTNPTGFHPPTSSTTPSPAPPTYEPASVTVDIPIDPTVGAIFDAIKAFTSPDGRALWATFKSLPNRITNSDYYTVIKQPVDMITIASKLLAREYLDVDKIFSDFALLFDNACRYYKPHTDQYKDAVTLHKVLVQKREQLAKGQPPRPNAPKLVQKIFRNLLKAIMQYKDPASGRRLSDSVWAAPPSLEHTEEHNDDVGDNVSVTSVTDLITIERRTIKGLYSRLDLLQDDVMGLLLHVQQTNTPDSQVHQDAVELQRVFLQQRDKLCGNGRLLWSPALSQYSLEQLKQQKEETRPSDDDDDLGECVGVDSDDGCDEEHRDYLESFEQSGQCYVVGDVAYVSPKKSGSCLPHIVAIEKLWRDKNSGDHWFSGSWFYRPEETFHVPTRRFIVNEIFRTNCHQMVRLCRAIGKCCVLRYKDYCRNKLESCDDESTFVCRDRYHIQMKSFKPLKSWGIIGKHWTLVPRQQPLKLEYVYSKFASPEVIAKLEGRRGNQPMATAGVVDDGESADMDETTSLSSTELEFHVEYDNVVSKDQTGVDTGCCSFDQYCLDQYCFRLGDFVYLRSDEQQSFIARIEKMWADLNGDPWFHGCWFLRPSETVHPPTRMFYCNELVMSNIADTNPMRSVIGKCAVLTFRDYCTWRPTELDEKDVYLCEERYNEHDKEFKKLKGLKKIALPSEVVEDEIYHLQEEITLHKEASPHLFSNLSGAETTDEITDSADIENVPSSVKVESVATSDYNTNELQPTVTVQPVTLFALDLQSQLRSQGSEMTLANVIQSAKNEWSKLPAEQQADYQLRASELSALLPGSTVAPNNTDLPAASKPPSIDVTMTTPTHTSSSYVCHWDGCGLQFPDVAGLFAHVTNLGPGTHIAREGASNYYCEWRNCHRHKQSIHGGKPFDTQAKMLRHLKEVHMSRAIKEKMTYSDSTPQWQTKDFSVCAVKTEAAQLSKLSSVLPATPCSVEFSTPTTITIGTILNTISAANTATTNSVNMLTSISAHQQQSSVAHDMPTVSSNKQLPQLLHTTVYTRYIEGLRQNAQHMSNWCDSRSIRCQQGTSNAQLDQHANQWLSSEAAPNKKNLVDALYQLRDHLTQDAAKLSKYISSI